MSFTITSPMSKSQSSILKMMMISASSTMMLTLIFMNSCYVQSVIGNPLTGVEMQTVNGEDSSVRTNEQADSLQQKSNNGFLFDNINTKPLLQRARYFICKDLRLKILIIIIITVIIHFFTVTDGTLFTNRLQWNPWKIC